MAGVTSKHIKTTLAKQLREMVAIAIASINLNRIG